MQRGIVGGAPRIVRMVVCTGRVGLPEFDHGVAHGCAIAIQYAAGKPDALALGFWASHATERLIHGELEVKKRADSLGRSALHFNPQMA
jgi:hypothetical protein